MATLTNEQIEAKKQLLAEKTKEMKAIYDELVEAGAIALGSPLATEGTQELPEAELGSVAGGGAVKNAMPTHTPNIDWMEWRSAHPELWYEDLSYLLDE